MYGHHTGVNWQYKSYLDIHKGAIPQVVVK